MFKIRNQVFIQHYFFFRKNSAGFTLIELLIVVAIIGIIVTFAIIFLSQSRAKARDAQRLADIKQISTALELYRADEVSYPTIVTPGQSLVGPTSGITYVKKLPTNPPPTNDGSCAVNEYTYVTTDSGKTYKITYCLGQATSEAAAGINVAKPYVIATGCTPDCTNKCAGEADGCGDTCSGTVAYEGGPYDSNGTTQVTGGYYRTVLIGAQCWLKDNLNVGTMISGAGNQTDNSTVEKYCYNGSSSNCSAYGGLYQWPEAVQYNNGVTLTSGTPAGGNIQGICPTGWHIASNNEYSTLSTYLGGDSVSGGAMRETGTAHWGDGTGATNSSGFTAVGNGYRLSGSFYNITSQGRIWTAYTNSSSQAYYRVLSSGSASLSANSADRAQGYSVRCLRD